MSKTADDIIAERVKDYLCDLPKAEASWEAIVSEVRVEPVLLIVVLENMPEKFKMIKKTPGDLNPIVRLIDN